eukprot:364536-Chlamydomonas_euryale.AAC.3
MNFNPTSKASKPKTHTYVNASRQASSTETACEHANSQTPVFLIFGLSKQKLVKPTARRQQIQDEDNLMLNLTILVSTQPAITRNWFFRKWLGMQPGRLLPKHAHHDSSNATAKIIMSTATTTEQARPVLVKVGRDSKICDKT